MIRTWIIETLLTGDKIGPVSVSSVRLVKTKNAESSFVCTT